MGAIAALFPDPVFACKHLFDDTVRFLGPRICENDSIKIVLSIAFEKISAREYYSIREYVSGVWLLYRGI